MRGKHVSNQCLGIVVDVVCSVGVNSRAKSGGPSCGLNQEEEGCKG